MMLATRAPIPDDSRESNREPTWTIKKDKKPNNNKLFHEVNNNVLAMSQKTTKQEIIIAYQHKNIKRYNLHHFMK